MPGRLPDERYSGARLPAASRCRARPSSTSSPLAQRTGVMVQQPALAGRGSRAARPRSASARRSMPRRHQAREDDHDFTPAARISSASISRSPSREWFPALQHARHRARRQGGLCQSRRWRTTISSARRMSRSFTRRAARAFTARSIAAPMSAISCWPAQALGLGTIPQASAGAAFRVAFRRHFKPRRRPPRRLRHPRARLCGTGAHKVSSFRTCARAWPITVTFVNE